MVCSNYFPDMSAMGDCKTCGHTHQAHRDVAALAGTNLEDPIPEEPTQVDVNRIEKEGLHSNDSELMMCSLLVNIRDCLYRTEQESERRYNEELERRHYG